MAGFFASKRKGFLVRRYPIRCECVKKSVWFFFMSFRQNLPRQVLSREPESSFFTALAIDWTPVFTGVTAEVLLFP
jgi:hypothetical protein